MSAHGRPFLIIILMPSQSRVCTEATSIQPCRQLDAARLKMPCTEHLTHCRLCRATWRQGFAAPWVVCFAAFCKQVRQWGRAGSSDIPGTSYLRRGLSQAEYTHTFSKVCGMDLEGGTQRERRLQQRPPCKLVPPTRQSWEPCPF